jgi:Spy/CpxP family protein refolding chaperone
VVKIVNRSRLKGIAILVATFALGGLSATAVYHALVERQYARLFSGEREAFERRRVQALARELDLTSAQQASVLAVFRKHSSEHKRLMRQTVESCGEPLTRHKEAVDREIRALLDADQKPRFDALRAEQRRRVFGPDAPSR